MDFHPLRVVRVVEVQQKMCLVLEKEVCERWPIQAIHSCIIIYYYHLLNIFPFKTMSSLLHHWALKATPQPKLCCQSSSMFGHDVLFLRSTCSRSSKEQSTILVKVSNVPAETQKSDWHYCNDCSWCAGNPELERR